MNEVGIKVTGENDSGRAIHTAQADVKALGEEAQKSAKKFVELGVSEERAAAEAGKMARKLDDVGDEAQQVARKMLELQVAAKIAAEQFARYGDDDSLNNLRKAKKELGDLQNVARNLGTKGGKSNLFDDMFRDAPKIAEKAGKEASGTFASAWQGGIIDSFKALPPEAQAAIGSAVGAAVVLSMPLIVSLINGAILGGIGAGGLAAGIAIQAKDPVVAGAFKTLGSTIMEDLKADTAPFKAELLSAADGFGQSWAKVQPEVKGFFDTLSPAVGRLSAGIGKGLEILGPSLARVAGPAEQVLSAVAAEIPEIAQAAGSLLDDVSKHGESAAEAIKFVLFNVEVLIQGFDLLVQSIAPVADGIVKVATAIGLIDPAPVNATITTLDRIPASTEAAGAGMSRLGEQVTVAGSQSSDSAASIDYMNQQVYNTADAANQANEAFNRLFGEMMGLDEANLKVAEDFRSLGSTIRKNNGDLSENTAGGQANRRMILGMIGDLEQQREAAIAAGNGTVEATRKANAAFLSQLQRIRAVTVANGGNTASIDAMIAKYRQLAATPDITIKITTIHDTQFTSSGQRLTGSSRNPGGGFEHGGIVGAAAAGGMRDGRIKVGEGGWEYVDLPPGSQVHPHGESQRMDDMSGGGGVLRVLLDVTGTPGDLLFELINKGLNDRKIIVRQPMIRAA